MTPDSEQLQLRDDDFNTVEPAVAPTEERKPRRRRSAASGPLKKFKVTVRHSPLVKKVLKVEAASKDDALEEVFEKNIEVAATRKKTGERTCRLIEDFRKSHPKDAVLIEEL